MLTTKHAELFFCLSFGKKVIDSILLDRTRGERTALLILIMNSYKIDLDITCSYYIGNFCLCFS